MLHVITDICSLLCICCSSLWLRLQIKCFVIDLIFISCTDFIDNMQRRTWSDTSLPYVSWKTCIL